MKLNEKQRGILDALAAKDAAYRHEKSVARGEELAAARIRISDRIRDRLIERDKAAALADEAGIPRSQIAAQGLSTTNTKDARRAIAHGKELLAAREIEDAETPQAVEAAPATWQIEDGVLTLTPEDLALYAAFVGTWTIPQSWRFELVDGHVRPADEDDDETWLNPVVQIVMAPNSPWRERVRAALD
ncbi:hypothetical protein [Microbacterium sp. No. 7]|uniref:hypothetical protein n=1 Tax=Microbacterium sp. No. 7 TaxID=1714373 RepID=UPI0006D09672|nr:hypothetical protein [Microbacterium sp. No. 7]ALJ19538.1 hypothetical protein AOA12_06290 [Microbacterium sp. No. 7]